MEPRNRLRIAYTPEAMMPFTTMPWKPDRSRCPVASWNFIDNR